MSQVVLDAHAMKRTLGRLAHEILESNQGAQDLVVIGILRKGWPLAKRLAFLMAQIEDNTIPHGKLDISSARDDRDGAQVNETEIAFDLTGKRVILVDEVIFTGRTVRSALEVLRQFGRPSIVQLAVMVDRGHRELPIQPDFCGRVVETDRDDHVEVQLSEYAEEEGVFLHTNSPASTPI